jgi:hypothetical protein
LKIIRHIELMGKAIPDQAHKLLFEFHKGSL